MILLSKNNTINGLIFIVLLFSLFTSTRNYYALYLFSVLGCIILIVLTSPFQFKKYKLGLLIILFLYPIYSILSSFWSINPSYTLIRGLYTFIIFVTSLIIASFSTINDGIYKHLTLLNILIVTLSLFSLFLNYPIDVWTANHGMGFTGFMQHQNGLAIILFMSSSGVVYYLFKNIKQNKNYILYLVLFSLNIILIILTHSRATLLSITFFIIITFLILSKKRIKILFLSGVLILVVALISVSIFNNYVYKYLLKGNDSFTATRTILWNPSINAATNGGFFGLGYGISDPKTESNFVKTNRYNVSIREKGNGYFAIVEELGLLGLLLFFILLIKPTSIFCRHYLNGIFKEHDLIIFNKNNLKNVIALNIIFSSLIHLLFESWIVGITRFQFIIFVTFLLYTNISDIKLNEKNTD